MFCSKCGIQNLEGATHCANCGSIMVDTTGQADQQPVEAIAVEPKTSRLAIAAFVMGLLCLTCVLWPILAFPAIICGIVALVKISNNRPNLKGNGYAVTGIVIPGVMMVLIPILAMLLAILMPALSQTKMIAQRVVCGTNLKGLSVAMHIYANDNDEILPTENWCDLLIEKADVSPKSFICPDSDAIEGESCYAMNENIAGLKFDELSPNVVLFFETDKGIESDSRNTPIKNRRYFEYHRVYNDNTFVYRDRFNQLGGPDDLILRHDQHGQSGCNIAFADGHVEFITVDRIGELQWTAE